MVSRLLRLVGGPSDDEHLVGECGDSGLVVSVSFKAKSCLASAPISRWVRHGDLLSMYGTLPGQYVHCMVRCLDEERSNVYVPLS